MLVFVYNADSGLFNTLTDFAHKLFSPRTYRCNLCALTHTSLGMKKAWKEFLVTNIREPIAFFHADELKAKFGPINDQLPAIFRTTGTALDLWMSAKEINACRSLEVLQQTIQRKL